MADDRITYTVVIDFTQYAESDVHYAELKDRNFLFVLGKIGISFLCLRQISHNFPQFPRTDILE